MYRNRPISVDIGIGNKAIFIIEGGKATHRATTARIVSPRQYRTIFVGSNIRIPSNM